MRCPELPKGAVNCRFPLCVCRQSVYSSCTVRRWWQILELVAIYSIGGLDQFCSWSVWEKRKVWWYEVVMGSGACLHGVSSSEPGEEGTAQQQGSNGEVVDGELMSCSLWRPWNRFSKLTVCCQTVLLKSIYWIPRWTCGYFLLLLGCFVTRQTAVWRPLNSAESLLCCNFE